MEDRDKKWSVGEGGDLPIGFGLSLAANAAAMDAFAGMSDAEKERVVEESRRMHSKQEMERFVNGLGKTSGKTE